MVDEALKQAEQRMQKAIEVARDEFGGFRTGRASPQLLQRLTVDYYGSQTPLQQLASFSVPEPRLLVIHPYDRNAMSSIEKAIQASDLGLNPSNDGTVIATGRALAALVFGTLFWRAGAFVVLAAAAILLAQYEFYGALSRRGYRPATAVGMATGAVILAGAFWRGPQALSFGVVLSLV